MIILSLVIFVLSIVIYLKDKQISKLKEDVRHNYDRMYHYYDKSERLMKDFGVKEGPTIQDEY